MNHQQAQELYSDYLTGDLDPALTVKLESYLTSSESEQEEMSALRRVWSDLDRMPVIEPPTLLHSNIMERIDLAREEAQAPKQRVWDWRMLFRAKTLALAATVLVALTIGIVQTQSAEINPLEKVERTVLHWFHPESVSPRILAANANWSASSGALVVRLQADSAGGQHTGSADYIVTLQRLPNGQPGQATTIASAKGHLSADETGLVTLKLSEAPDPTTDSLLVTVLPVDGQQEQIVKVVLPSVSAPLAP